MNFFDNRFQLNRRAIAFGFGPQSLHERIVAIEKAKHLVTFNFVRGFVGFDDALNADPLNVSRVKTFDISNGDVFRAARLFIIRQ